MMRHRTILAISTVAGLLAFGACTTPTDAPTGAVTSVAIDQGDQTLVVGASVALTATVQVSGSVDESVTWTSDDSSVASVDGTGTVTAQSAGVAAVTATSAANDSVSASVDVTVVESVLDPSRAFTVGIVPPIGAADVDTHVATLESALASALGRPVTFTTYGSFAGLLSDVLDRSVEIAFLAPRAVVTAIDDGDAVAVLTAVRFGAVSYRGEFYAQCGSTFTSPEALNGARFGFVDPGSMAGYRVPYVTLVALGIDPDIDMSSEFAGSHDAVILGIYDDSLDAGVTFEGGVSTIAGSYPDVEDLVCSIGFTPDIPNDGVVVRGGVAASEREAITASMTTMLETQATSDALAALIGGEGLLEPTPEGIYDIIRDVDETFF